MVSFGIERFSAEIAHLLQRREELEFKLGYLFKPESGVKTTISERERFELVDFAEYVVDQVL